MSDHDRRSHAGSPPAAMPRPRWERPDVPRPGPRDALEGVLDLDPLDGAMVLLDPPDAPGPAELFGLLPQAARRDLVAGLDGARA